MDWKASLAAILKAHGAVSAGDAKRISFATAEKRAEVLFQSFAELRAMGYRLHDVHGLREKHVRALAEHWERAGKSASTIQNKLSILRVFAGWIGKPGMVRDSTRYVRDPASVRRHTATRTDKSWSAAGVDIPTKIAQVRARDPRVAVQLEMQRVFGLRVKESLMLKPHMADKGTFLNIAWGTKGGRDRVVPITTPEQRHALAEAKALAGSLQASTSDPRLSLKQVRDHYYYVVRACGISRVAGAVSHGLRHERLHKVYEETAGIPSPVRGGDPGAIPADRHHAAMQEVAEIAGHSREAVSTAYVGTTRDG